MSLKTCVLVFALCLVLCVLTGMAVQPAYAQISKAGGAAGVDMPDSGGGDKGLAGKSGVSGALTTKGKNNKPTATKTQMYIGVGSIFVMIAVVKWL